MALIPKGPHRGSVVAWDIDSDQALPEWKQRWAIVDPLAPGGPTFQNFELSMPTDEGDLFCAGLTWTREGDLLVAGGTSSYPYLVARPPKQPRAIGSLAAPSCSSGAQGCCTPRGPTSPTGPSPHIDGCGAGCGCGCLGSDAGPYLGGKLTFLWNPDDSVWYRQPDMAIDRWYPTAVARGNGTILVGGGVTNTQAPYEEGNNYEVFVLSGTNPPAGTWQTGPAGQLFAGPPNFTSLLYIYPRLFQLTTGNLFLAGMTSHSASLDHANAPGVWVKGEKSLWDGRVYGSAVLMPFVPDANGNYLDEVLILGGSSFDYPKAKRSSGLGPSVVGYGPQSSVQVSHPTAVDKRWSHAPSMIHKRKYPNGVLLPDGSLLVMGGTSGRQSVFHAELFDGTSWTELPPQDTPRTYHSTALLLPDGRVLSAGGNTAQPDYQVFVPTYLCAGDPRPVVTVAPATMGYYAESPAVHTIGFEPLPAGHSVERAVLISPGATTHHNDYNQRYVQLIAEGVSFDHIDVRAPAQRNLVPPGYYMLFLISAAGVPSEASWVKVL
jgi:hypothetical protein